MQMSLKQIRGQLSLPQEFMLISLVIVLGGMFSIGWWVANRIENAVIEHGAKMTTLYMNTFIPPMLEDMVEDQNIDELHQHMLRHLLSETPLTNNIIWLNVWTPDHQLVYSSLSPLQADASSSMDQLDAAIHGEIISNILIPEEQQDSVLIQTVVPVFDKESGEVISVVESYQDATALRTQIEQAQQQSWLVVGIATIIMYLLLSGLVRGANHTINQQQEQLRASVSNLQSLLTENQNLHAKVQIAAVRANEINEQFLHRLGHDLHDGPAQDIALALLRIGDIGSPEDTQITTIYHALESALNEIRSIAAGLQLPELQNLSLEEVARRAIREFKRKTGADVGFEFSDKLPKVSISKKQIIYRAMTEILNNAYKHADAAELKGHMLVRDKSIYLEISDAGKGFDPTTLHLDHERLGLIGLQQRVMLIDGTVDIRSELNHGTKVIVTLPIGDTNS